MVDLTDLNLEGYVLEPACGSGGFLISALNKILNSTLPEDKIRDIKQNQVYGIEIQDRLFTLAMSNMFLIKSTIQFFIFFILKEKN